MTKLALLTALVLSAATLPAATTPSQLSAPGATLLDEISETFTKVADKAMPATVSIKAQIQPIESEGQNPFNPLQDEFFRRFFGGGFGVPQQIPQQPVMAGGSGFIIRSDGYIATNYHVVKEATQITVMLNDGREYTATVKGSDPQSDIAVLKIEEKDLPTLEFGDSDELKMGQWVVAIGSPFGLEGSLTVGVVSGKDRQEQNWWQTNAAINHGNSGGPICDLNGAVRGIATAMYTTQGGGNIGISFAIPSNIAKRVTDQIILGNAIKRGYLGILLQPVDKEFADALSLNKEGVLISEVLKDSAAQKGGLVQGDIIVAYNDKPVKSVSKIRSDIALMDPGAPLKLKVLRNNKPLTLNLTLGSQEPTEVAASEITQKMGLEVENLSAELGARLGYASGIEGVAISKVKPNSSAALAGLRPGFLVTGVAVSWGNQKPVKNVADFEEAIKELGNSKHLILIVRHQNFQRYYTLKVQ
jgi:serine protease Do